MLVEALADQPTESYERDTQVAIILSKFGFEKPDGGVAELSGGWRKRLALAREIIQQPDLLLMDEPTNHLDIEGIQWLEKMLLGVPFSFVAVSHDRYFLEHVTTRVVELNPVYPDGYFSVSGSYSMYLEKRADFLEAQRSQQVTLANIVRREVAFLKSNSKAQRTKSKSRIEDAYRLKDELRDLSQRKPKEIGDVADLMGYAGRHLILGESGQPVQLRQTEAIAMLDTLPDHIEKHLVSYINGFSENVRRIFEFFEFENEIEKMREANVLFLVISKFADVDLHPHRVPNAVMGRIFENLIRRFNDERGPGEPFRAWMDRSGGATTLAADRPPSHHHPSRQKL